MKIELNAIWEYSDNLLQRWEEIERNSDSGEFLCDDCSLDLDEPIRELITKLREIKHLAQTAIENNL